MTLGSDIAAALPELRAQAESRMTETFQFFTPTEVVVGLTTTPGRTLIGAPTRGRLKATNTEPAEPETGGQFPVVTRHEVHVPVGSVNVADGVMVEVTASTLDVSLAGRVFRVSARPKSGQTTAWRYPVTEV